MAGQRGNGGIGVGVPVTYGNNSSVYTDTSWQDFGAWFNNALTGQRDFDRQMDLQKDAQLFNSAEAQKAFDREVFAAQNATLWQADQYKQLGINPAWAMTGGGQSSAPLVASSAARSNAATAPKSGQQFGNLLSAVGSLILTGVAVGANNALSAVKKLKDLQPEPEKNKIGFV